MIKKPFHKLINWHGLTKIRIYPSFATPEHFFVHGHVFNGVAQSRKKISNFFVVNAWEMLKRFMLSRGDQIDLDITIAGVPYRVTTDRNGYFFLQDSYLKQHSRLKVEVALVQDAQINQSISLKVIDPEQAIISDIDDTVLVSHATNPRKKLYLLLTKNPRTRKPFQGVVDHYHQFHQSGNDVFIYVSSSEWNLFDFIDSFFSFHDFPPGYFLLQDLKKWSQLLKTGGGSHRHKFDKIQWLLNFLPRTTFILIGDDGQQDPFIYHEVAMKYPHRIKHIYLRRINKKTIPNFDVMQKELLKQGIEISPL
jgi:phosphatidate phosphatase APP1